MAKPKRKLTAQEKAEKKRRRQGYMTIFIRGNADALWYHQNEMWEEIGRDEENE